MRTVLLATAAALAAASAAAPAGAQSWSGSAFTDGGGDRSHDSGGFTGPFVDRGEFRCDVGGRGFRDGFGLGGDGDRRRHRRGRGVDCVFVGGTYYESRDWDGNRSFDPDRWNDWWHDRPWRSYPGWMSRNENCERQWWSGGGWRC